VVDRDSPLGRTDWVLNRIEVVADPVGTVAFSGPGAGGDATSSAVLGDLIALARGHGSTWAGLAPATAVRPPAPGASGEVAAMVTESAGPLAGARAWFAFLPGVAPNAVRVAAADAAAADAAAGDAIDAATDVAGGTAVRTKPITLAAARAALAAASGASDATLYLVVD
jgi:homoserine dehydrogenase